MIDIEEFTGRYVTMRNEGDPTARHDLSAVEPRYLLSIRLVEFGEEV